MLPHFKYWVFSGCGWLGGWVRGNKMCVVIINESGVWDEGW